MTNLKMAGCASHISLKAPKVDETWAGKITRLVVIDAEEEVQGERGDHGGKELQAEQTKKRNIKSSAEKLGQRSHTKCCLRFSMSASGSRKRLLPLERTELHLFRKKKENILMNECQIFLPM